MINRILTYEVLGFETRVFEAINSFMYEGMGSYFGLFEEMAAPFKSISERYIQHTFFYYYCREYPCNLVVSTDEKMFQQSMMRVFPNPTTGILSFTGKPTQNSIQLYSASGKICHRVLGSENTIDLSDLANGLYVICWEDEMGRQSQKIMLQ